MSLAGQGAVSTRWPALVDDYARRLWKDHPWYHRVDWQRVASAVDDVLQNVCRDGLAVGDDLADQLRPVERDPQPDRC